MNKNHSTMFLLINSIITKSLMQVCSHAWSEFVPSAGPGGSEKTSWGWDRPRSAEGRGGAASGLLPLYLQALLL